MNSDKFFYRSDETDVEKTYFKKLFKNKILLKGGKFVVGLKNWMNFYFNDSI